MAPARIEATSGRGWLSLGAALAIALLGIQCAQILDISGLGVASSAAPDAGETVGADAAPDAGGTVGADAAADAGGSVGADAAPTGLPYMLGYRAGNTTSAPATIESWLGRPMDLVGTSVTTVNYISSGPYQTSAGALTLLDLDFPILSANGESNDLDDMSVAASGGYDSTYTSMAQAIAAAPNPILTVSIGTQFNGGLYPWSSGVGKNATTANYVAAFQRIATIVRQTNPKALIEWNLAWGGADPTPYWPGKYDPTTNPGGVDVISIVFYEGLLGGADWAKIQSGGGIDLDWMVSYAQQKGVKIALSEYSAGASDSGGIGTGTGLDDGPWVVSSVAWMNSQPAGFLLWEEWSGFPGADDLVTPGANPKEEAVWIASWRKTYFAGAWWTGTPPP